MMMGDAGASGGGNTNQFIGSKISLISKSEIRYEGILYSLDLEEATISLQKVRSFGTEDRVTSRPVGPKDEVYEFIIFRGADIKGIDVLEPPPQGKEEESEPVDPAIVEVQHYQPQQPQVTQPAQQQAVVGGSIGMDNRAFGNNGFGMGGAPGNVIPQHQIPSQAMHQGFSLGVGFGNGVAEVPPQRGGVVGQAVPPQQQQVVSQHQSVRPSSPSASHGGQQDPKSPSSPDNRSSSNQRRSYAPRGRGGSNDSRGGLQQQQRGGGGGGGGGGQAFQQRGGGQQSQRGYYQNRYTNGDARGQGQRKFYRRGELKGNKKITFDGEFDFEKANEELQKALMKIKIADGDVEDEEEEAEQKPDDGEELDKENERKEFYQKDNFFDNISCEALERKQGKRERPDWRAERKLNAETFGLPMKPGGPRGGGSSSTYYRGGGGGGYHSHNSYYNNYGGGRGGYGYGRGGGGGGGQYRGYRGRGGYGRGSRGNNGGGGERNLERAVAPKD